MKKTDKFLNSIKELENALTYVKKIKKDKIYFNGIVKSYETCLEYAWKYLKAEVNDQGIEAHSPKEAIKHSGRMNLISDVELWLKFLLARNQSVHDYLGINEEKYLELIQKFYKEVKLL